MKRPLHVLLAGVCLAGVLVLNLCASRSSAATPQEVEASIAKARKYLLSKQKANGSWEQGAQVPAAGDKEQQWGGLTAMATYALLAAGESHQGPQLAKAIEFLRKADMTGTYAVGLRAAVWASISPQPDFVRAAATHDQALLAAGMGVNDIQRGLYSYDLRNPAGSFNKSTSQYGVLGMWACERSGIPVNSGYWKVVDEAWKRDQNADGGWGYEKTYGSSPTMTLAGVATLLVALDYTDRTIGLDCKGNAVQKEIEAGLNWLSAHHEELFTMGGYAMYGVERVGVASGRKCFGKLNWYDTGAEKLVRSQGPEGQWYSAQDSVDGTAFGLLFLARGRGPVVINKIEYDQEPSAAVLAATQAATQPEEGAATRPAAVRGPWNQRSRDVANVVRWLGGRVERGSLNWQVLNLKESPLDDLHDSQVLYLSGNQELRLSPEAEDKLRQYVYEGGIVLGHADAASKVFSDSFRRLGTRLFGGDFRPLPPDHLIFKENSAVWKKQPALEGLSNGCRELMLLMAADDPARTWQMQDFKLHPDAGQLAANIIAYSVDREFTRYKGVSYVVRPDEKIAAARSTRLARVRYTGNWDPEPGGWQRLTAILHNRHKLDLKVEPVALGEGKLRGYRIAHLTGTDAINFDAAARTELKAFVEGGGTLLIDAAGGSRAFADSAEAMLKELFADSPLAVLPPEHPMYSAGGAALGPVTYRFTARRKVGNLTTPLLKGITIRQKAQVLFSAEDLSVGMVGQTVDGICGYAPASATEIVLRTCLYSLGM